MAAGSKKKFIIEDYGLSSIIRKRIDALVGLQLTPTTINLFTSEFSQVDDEIKMAIAMYIAKLLEIENAIMEDHFESRKETNIHGNAREHLILEKRKANLQRIQQIFINQLNKQPRANGQEINKFNEEGEHKFGPDFKKAMVTNSSNMSEADTNRIHSSNVAQVRRNKEMYDFDLSQLKKLLVRYQKENNIQKILDIEQRIKITEREYFLRRDAILRTINGENDSEQSVEPSNMVYNARQHIMELQNENKGNDFFSVSDNEYEEVTKGQPSNMPTHNPKNKLSDIPDEVLSNNFFTANNTPEIHVSNDISNPNKAALQQIDDILSKAATLDMTIDDADATQDPFLMLLAQENEFKRQAKSDINIVNEKPKTKLKAKTKAEVLKKSTETVVKPKNDSVSKKELEKSQKLLAKKTSDLSTTNNKLNELLSEKRILEQQARHFEKKANELDKMRLENEALEVKINDLEIQKKGFLIQAGNSKNDMEIIELDKKIDLLETENNKLLEKLDETQNIIKSSKEAANAREEALKQQTRELEVKAKELKMLLSENRTLETKINDLEKEIKNAPMQGENVTNGSSDRDLEAKIKLLEEENEQLILKLEKSSQTIDSLDDVTVQRKKASRAIDSLRNLMIERLKGINLLNNLREKQKIQYNNIAKDTHLAHEAQLVKQNLFVKEKAYIAKRDLEKKEQMQELKHQILVGEDIKQQKNSADEILTEAMETIEPMTINWVDDFKDDDLLDVTDDGSIEEVVAVQSERTNLALDLPLDLILKQQRDQQDWDRLKRKANFSPLTHDEAKRLKKYQEQSNTKSLRNYHLINNLKK